MKKILGIMAVVLLVAGTCLALDYANHVHTPRIYRVALGSGNAPSASDMAKIRLHNGDMVLNTDDNVLYIMHDTNVYTKVTAVGAMEPVTFTATDINPLTVGGIKRGVQSVALGTNETASVTITATQVDVTGPTNAAEAVVTLGLPGASQLGQFVGIRNVGTSTVQVVHKAATTNELATTERSFLQSVSTSEWEVIYTTP